jgi:hypothetical protein
MINQNASNTIIWQQICNINKRLAKERTPNDLLHYQIL